MWKHFGSPVKWERKKGHGQTGSIFQQSAAFKVVYEIWFVFRSKYLTVDFLSCSKIWYRYIPIGFILQASRGAVDLFMGFEYSSFVAFTERLNLS